MWLTIPAVRCWCLPVPARARPRRSTKPSPQRVRAGGDPERILVLTFSRKAAVELRDRMAARLAGGADRTLRPAGHHLPLLLLRAGPRPPGRRPLRRAAAAAVRARTGPLHPRAAGGAARAGAREGAPRVRWPDELRACLTTRGFADEVRAVLARSRELGLGPDALGDVRPRAPGGPTGARRRASSPSTWTCSTRQGVLDYAELVHRAVLLAERDGRRGRAARALRRRLRRRVPGHRPVPGAAAARPGRAAAAPWSPSATPTSRSTPSAAPT